MHVSVEEHKIFKKRQRCGFESLDQCSPPVLTGVPRVVTV